MTNNKKFSITSLIGASLVSAAVGVGGTAVYYNFFCDPICQIRNKCTKELKELGPDAYKTWRNRSGYDQICKDIGPPP